MTVEMIRHLDELYVRAQETNAYTDWARYLAWKDVVDAVRDGHYDTDLVPHEGAQA